MKLFRVVAMLVVAVVASSALADASVNLHNGYIAIRNESSAPLRVTVQAGGWSNHLMFDGTIAPHSTYDVNNCCYAAGTRYFLEAFEPARSKPYEWQVVPRLCNTRGIPYGFASLTFGYVQFAGKDVLNFYPTDRGCP